MIACEHGKSVDTDATCAVCELARMEMKRLIEKVEWCAFVVNRLPVYVEKASPAFELMLRPLREELVEIAKLVGSQVKWES